MTYVLRTEGRNTMMLDPVMCYKLILRPSFGMVLVVAVCQSVLFRWCTRHAPRANPMKICAFLSGNWYQTSENKLPWNAVVSCWDWNFWPQSRRHSVKNFN